MSPIDPDLEEQRSETQFNWLIGGIFTTFILALIVSWVSIWRFVS